MKQYLLTMLLLIGGCNAGGLTPNQRAEANKQWNDARAGVLASLASDQYKNGNFDKCQETLDQALRLEPGNAALHLLAARLGIEQGKLEVAQSHLAEAAKLDPQNAEADYLSGVVFQRWQEPEKACDAYAAAVAKSPEEISFLLAEAEMQIQSGNPDRALTLLQSKAGLFEHSAVLRDEIGQILVQMCKYDKAIAVLRDASALASDDLSIREHLGFALFTNKQYSQAKEVLARLSKAPEYEKRADVLAALGECHSQNNEFREANLSYTAAVELQPKSYGYLMGLARSLTQLNEWSGAEEILRRAIAVEPRRGDAKCLMGYVHLQQNKLAPALASFREAADADPTDAVSLSLEGYVLQRMGRNSEALPCFRRALHINPDDDLTTRLVTGINPND